MELKRFVAEKRAVSPVIGVILMVAITVILAAVIGTMVLGIGSSERFNTHPQADFGWETENMDDGDADNDILKVTHQSGESIDTERLAVVVASDEIYDAGALAGPGGTSVSGWGGSSISAGSQLVYDEDSSSDEFQEGDEARIIWTGSEGKKSAIISKFTL